MYYVIRSVMGLGYWDASADNGAGNWTRHQRDATRYATYTRHLLTPDQSRAVWVRVVPRADRLSSMSALPDYAAFDAQRDLDDIDSPF